MFEPRLVKEQSSRTARALAAQHVTQEHRRVYDRNQVSDWNTARSRFAHWKLGSEMSVGDICVALVGREGSSPALCREGFELKGKNTFGGYFKNRFVTRVVGFPKSAGVLRCMPRRRAA